MNPEAFYVTVPEATGGFLEATGSRRQQEAAAEISRNTILYRLHGHTNMLLYVVALCPT